jgi:hypothetical protein
MKRTQLALLVLSLLGGLWPAAASAEEPVAPACPCPARPVPCVAWWAVPSDTGHYVGYYVGGGCVRHGRPPAPDEGTWGWDYGGCLIHPGIRLLWCDCPGGRRNIPAYRTVGKEKGNNPNSP